MISLFLICRCFRPKILAIHVTCFLGGFSLSSLADEIHFNTDILDVKERGYIDVGRFSRSGYIMPGEYQLTIYVNKHELSEMSVTFYATDDEKNSQACIRPEIVKQLGLKPSAQNDLAWQHEGACLAVNQIPGMIVQGDLATSALYISLPQAYLEYTDESWDPPSRWDDGIPGLLVDYNVNAQVQHQKKQENQPNSLSSNGTVGANIGAWRLRADWQSQLNSWGGAARNNWDWSRYYAYRAMPNLGGKLLLGETFLASDIFDSFRFSGVSLMSDDSMLPPNLRGYAPEVVGIARTDAKVTVTQEGRILYETRVAAGPFRIQDINNSVAGQMLVRVEESDGSTQEFILDTASIPYLTRPGMVRYKLAAGRPSNWQHQANGSPFATGEFSWGVSNGWSLYGGSVAGGNYNALALGVGRDLMAFGALSFDATHSRASLSHEEQTLEGNSYRLSYSKRFDEYNSQVTFAGYRFSEQDFMSMNEYLEARELGTHSNNSKEMYTVTFNKQFVDLRLSAYINYTQQTYWERPENKSYNLTLSRYFDIGRFKNLSTSLTAYHNQYGGSSQDGMYLSLSIPWGNYGAISYASVLGNSDTSHQMSYSDRINNYDSYQLASGFTRNGTMASGYYNLQGSQAQMNTYASYRTGSYSSVGLSLRGGATATMQGAALHRSNSVGGTRLMVDTDGVANIPVQGYGANTKTNHFGKAVVTDVSNYYRNKISIDIKELPDNVEVSSSVVQATLTEGAIGYRRFDVVSGEKGMAVIRMADGSFPPFGANVFNKKMKEVGIVGESGNIYLSGMNTAEQMEVHWEGRAQCVITLPDILSFSTQAGMLLPCRSMKNTSSPVIVVQ